MELPKADQLKRGSAGAFDPHQLLGVDAGASPQDIRAAYVAKARLYHPDQFANHPLPPEVSEYLQAMFVHVQSAYELLSPRGGNKEREPAEAET
jgi:DnaJ-class molecular chaperone